MRNDPEQPVIHPFRPDLHNTPCFWCVVHPLVDPHCNRCFTSDGAKVTHIGRDEYLYCDRHRIRCRAGGNILSTWRDENEAIWRKRWEWLQQYEEVELYGPKSPDCPSDLRALFDVLEVPS